MTSPPVKTVRLSVPVTPEVQATFQRLAEASGRSMAASMAQWLVDTQDAAELMAQQFERLRASPGDVVARVRLQTASLEDFAQQAIDDAMDRADALAYPHGRPSALDARRAGRGGDDAARSGGRRASGGSAGGSPPSSNTGGKGARPPVAKPGGRSSGSAAR